MRRFRFPLESVLRLRQTLEDEALMLLAARQRELASREAELSRLQEQRRAHELVRAEQRVHRPTGDRQNARGLSIDALLAAEEYAAALESAAKAQSLRVSEARAAVEEAVTALQKRRTDREAVERLRDARLRAHREEALREEQRFLDEVGTGKPALGAWRLAPTRPDQAPSAKRKAP